MLYYKSQSRNEAEMCNCLYGLSDAVKEFLQDQARIKCLYCGGENKQHSNGCRLAELEKQYHMYCLEQCYCDTSCESRPEGW
jgi:hypothetical protein